MKASRTDTPPNLKTLHTQPSWHNRAGRIDRSACFTLAAAPLWRRIPDDQWTYRYPARQPTHRAKGKCDRHATITLWARDLWLMHKLEPPKRIQGDHRTAKSNAMKTGVRGTGSGVQQDTGSKTQAPNPVPGPPHPVPSPPYPVPYTPTPTRPHLNPNRGVGFNMHKALGLDCLWQTTLRIERVVQHARLKQHFLVCPVCSGGTGFQPVIPTQPNDRQDACPTPSTSRPTKLPTGRCTKLYLPLATPQEIQDAQRAQLWLNTFTQPNRPLTDTARQLIQRYGELFGQDGQRQPRCRHCLALRYGEVKPHQRTTHPRMTQQRLRRSRSRNRNRNRDDPNHEVRLRARERSSRPRAHPSCSDKPPQRVRPQQTEQQLFLQNLPKLLARPKPAPMPRPRPTPGTRHPDDLTRAEQDALLLDLLRRMPSFRALKQARAQHK